MELTESIRSRAYRTLRNRKGFRYGKQSTDLVPSEVKAMMRSDEELLGVYQNTEVDDRTNVIFTTRGVYKFQKDWICLEYGQMEKVKVPGWGDEGFDKQMAGRLAVHYKDG